MSQKCRVISPFRSENCPWNVKLYQNIQHFFSLSNFNPHWSINHHLRLYNFLSPNWNAFFANDRDDKLHFLSWMISFFSCNLSRSGDISLSARRPNCDCIQPGAQWVECPLLCFSVPACRLMTLKLKTCLGKIGRCIASSSFFCCGKKSWCSWWSVQSELKRDADGKWMHIKKVVHGVTTMRLCISRPPTAQCDISLGISLFTQKTVTVEVILLMCVRTCVYTIRILSRRTMMAMNYKFQRALSCTHNERALLLAGCERIRQFAASLWLEIDFCQPYVYTRRCMWLFFTKRFARDSI